MHLYCFFPQLFLVKIKNKKYYAFELLYHEYQKNLSHKKFIIIFFPAFNHSPNNKVFTLFKNIIYEKKSFFLENLNDLRNVRRGVYIFSRAFFRLLFILSTIFLFIFLIIFLLITFIYEIIFFIF